MAGRVKKVAGADIAVPIAPERAAAWQALSDLFLDTSLDERDIASIARRLRATGFAVGELERIYEEEVAPVCSGNLTALPGGVWSGFDHEWLVTAIRDRPASLADRLPWLRRLQVRRWTQLTRDDWQRVRRLIVEAPPEATDP